MLALEKEPVDLISLNKYMPLQNRKRKKIYPFWEPFKQTLNKYIPAENKIRKNKSSEDFLLDTYFHAEVWKVSLENMEDKILRFQFEPVSTKQTRPSYNDWSNQDEPETHLNRSSSQECYNCQKSNKMPKIHYIHWKTPVLEWLFKKYFFGVIFF